VIDDSEKSRYVDAARLLDEISTAPFMDVPLYRGLSLKPQSPFAIELSSLKAGDTLDWPPSGFSPDPVIAEGFVWSRSQSAKETKVLVTLQKGSQALSMEPDGDRGMWAHELERAVAGSFEVVSVETKDTLLEAPATSGRMRADVINIVIRQTYPISIPDGMTSWSEKLQLNSTTASALIELACYDASCAPPPVGTGGSKSGGGGGLGEFMRKSVGDVVDSKLRAKWSKRRSGKPKFYPVLNYRESSASGKAKAKIQSSIDTVLEQISAIHDVPKDIPTITFHYGDPKLIASGEMQRSGESTTDPNILFIQVNHDAESMNTVAHELGHYFDWGDMGSSTGTYGSGEFSLDSGPYGQSEEMVGWAKAAYNTPEIKALRSELIKAKSSRDEYITVGAVDGEEGVELPRRRVIAFYNYLLKPSEVWARSYAQFVAVESKNPEMMSELRSIQNDERDAHFDAGLNLTTWSDESFAPVQEAILETIRMSGVNNG
jgi:hypothetical protein